MTETNALSKYVTPAPDFSSMPVTFYIGAPPLFGIALILAGVIGPFIVGGILGLLGLFMVDAPDAWFWIVLGFAAIPLLAIPWGWWVLHSKTVVHVGPEQVILNRTTPLRNTGWETPLAEYTAVAYLKIVPPARNTGGTTTHAVELVHRTGEYDVRLVNSTDEDLVRGVLKQLSVLIGLEIDQSNPIRRG